jgi:hypothetical protein
MNEEYQRDDIYYCMCCGQFRDIKTHSEIHVPFEELPVEFAIQVMSDRQKSGKGSHKTRPKPKRSSKGFGRTE